MPDSGATDPPVSDRGVNLVIRPGEAPEALDELAGAVSDDGRPSTELNQDFATWFEDVGSDLLLRCAHSVCGRELFEDIAFEAAGKIYEQWADPRKRQLFTTHNGYVYQVVRYAFLSYRRKAANRPELHDELPGEADSAFWSRAGRDSGFEVRQALLFLDDEKAELVFLRYFLNLTLSATAREMGRKRGEAEKLHKQALAELKEILGPEGAG